MYSQRIRLIGDVTEVMYARFSKILHAYEMSDEKEPIVIELCSNGGSVYSALAISGRIRNSPKEIYIVAYGCVMSSAVLILASGDKRYISPEAWVMLHESNQESNGNTTAIRTEAAQALAEEQQWAELLSELSLGKASAKKFLTMSKNVVYLNAAQAVDVGLADEVMQRKVL